MNSVQVFIFCPLDIANLFTLWLYALWICQSLPKLLASLQPSRETHVARALSTVGAVFTCLYRGPGL